MSFDRPTPPSLSKRAARGFTMVELLAVVALLGILASLAFPLTESAARRVRESEFRHALREIRTAIDAYKLAFDTGLIAKQTGDSGYPSSLDILVQGVVNQKSVARERLYFLRRVPRDPNTVNDPRWRGQWQLRSYASTAHDPQPGRDVFDVYSASRLKGSNGVPYKDW